MRNLFLCKTPYQIMVATQMIITDLHSDVNDVLVADTIANCSELVRSLKQSHIFNSVFEFPVKAQYSGKGKLYYIGMGLLAKMGIVIDPLKIGNETYDRFYFCNLSMEESLVYRYLKKNNHEIEIFLYEDGFASYSKMYGEFFNNLYKNRGICGKLTFLLRKIYFEVFYYISGMHAYSPELFAWSPKWNIYIIPKINPHDKTVVEAFDLIFGVQTIESCYGKKYIFFEESYYADSKPVDDIAIINELLRYIPKDSLTVKIHPRNPENRFEKMGITTNANTTIPWEIIALNIDMSDKVLITIASGSALTSLINTSITPQKVIMLMNCKEISDEWLTPTLPLLREIALGFPQVVDLPVNIDEIKKCLENI